MNKGERTKANLVETAAELFRRQGLRATGINQIIAESGAPRGSLYYHFPGGKEELACAALRAAASTWRADLQAFMSDAPTVADAVHDACRALGNRLKTSGYTLGCPVATVSLELDDDEDALRDICDEHFRAWEAYLMERLLLEGGDKNEAREWAVVILAGIEGALLLSKIRRSSTPLRHTGQRLRTELALRRLQQGAAS